MRKSVLIFKCILPFIACLTANAQAQVITTGSTMQDLSGKAILNTKLSEVEGSVFYKDNYLPATLTLENGSIITGRNVKLNLKDNIVYYLDINGAELEAVSRVKRIEFTDSKMVFQNGFPAVENQTANTYYRVLTGGNASLLECTKFSEGEYKPYNATVAIKRIDKVFELYGASSKAIAKLSSQEDILLVLADKSKEVNDFILEKKLKCRKQGDFDNVIKYYNSLH
ncbi:MAG: hypothetical protein RLZZ28_2192 [Bacteroidota bacterium]|jgi:hypothetical protein